MTQRCAAQLAKYGVTLDVGRAWGGAEMSTLNSCLVRQGWLQLSGNKITQSLQLRVSEKEQRNDDAWYLGSQHQY
jgi:hypothetical protein